jgi:hypothetical protein
MLVLTDGRKLPSYLSRPSELSRLLLVTHDDSSEIVEVIGRRNQLAEFKPVGYPYDRRAQESRLSL